ncbi:coiled-coil domain-containing protein 9B-like [Carassius carassius]|uniref:coiled-coil domain-containing protein 9B-like n=1 Tax=Carassius carassius TaxID=217509 RepID=UPI002868558C|nr:coiled-coil domain-containing protein 9B-like [Carassius carassius]
MMMMMMMKEHKDAELDKKIEALRKKNEALMKRYQEVEEDKKRAEQEVMPLHSRKGKPDDLTITINKSSNGKRVFGERKDRNLKSCAEEEPESNNTRENQSIKRVTQVTEAIADLNLVSSQEEQLEYLRWKKEREEIDRERVARHKNAEGQWRRAWDMEKTDLMFSEKEHEGASNRGGRNTRRGNSRVEGSRGGQQASDRKRKCVPVVGSKAKGKERLTGRARR